MAKTAFITGATGQDGAYLAKLLLEKGYAVVGGVRRTSSSNTWRLRELGIDRDVQLVDFDLLELGNILRTVGAVEPDEIYNLAAQSFVGVSFELPLLTADVDALGALRLLEAIRITNPRIKYYQASTSEMFGKVVQSPQTESTPFYPRSPYGVSKLFAHWATVNYRESHNIFAASGILFNHESPLRGEEFVTRKITLGLSRVKRGMQERLFLGNIDTQRDWGFAGDYVEGMHAMLQLPAAEDFVLATGKTHSVREFVSLVARHLGLKLDWSGSGMDEVAVDTATGKAAVGIDAKLYRPAEVDYLRGNARKAKEVLGWEPRHSFAQVAEIMAEADERRVAEGRL